MDLVSLVLYLVFLPPFKLMAWMGFHHYPSYGLVQSEVAFWYRFFMLGGTPAQCNNLYLGNPEWAAPPAGISAGIKVVFLMSRNMLLDGRRLYNERKRPYSARYINYSEQAGPSRLPYQPARW